MKILNYVTVLAAAGLLLSCAKEVVIYKDHEPGVPTSLSITVRADEITTRAGIYDDNFPGNTITQEERRIYNMVLVVFDDRQLLEVYKLQSYYSEATGGFIGNSSAETVFLFTESDAQPITTGVHYFYVVANVPKPLLEKESLFNQRGLSITEFERQILDIPDIKLITARNNEARGFMMTNTDGPKREYLQPSTPGATSAANNFTINIGRAMAKVSVAYLPDSDGEPNGHLEDITYKVVNNPNQMYVMPYLKDGIVITPHFNETSYNPERFSDTSADDYLDAILENTPREEMTATYAMENNNLMELKGNSTMIRIKAKFVPEQWLDAGGDPTTGNSTGTFWRIAKVNSADEIVSFTAGYYAQEPTGLDSDEKVVEYTGGISYYPFWIQSPNGDYMVKRNMYYKVAITYVAGAGYPDEGGGIDPTDPIENYTTIRALVRMVDWEAYGQEAEL